MKRFLLLLCFIPCLSFAQNNAASTATGAAYSSAANQGNKQSITFAGPDRTEFAGSYNVKTTGAAILPGFSGSFSSDYCGATAGAAGGGMGFAFSVGAPVIDQSCVLLRTFERTMQAAQFSTNERTASTIRDAALEVLAEVDPKVRQIFETKGLVAVKETETK